MPNPRKVTIGQTLELADGEYTLAGYSAGIYKLRNNLSREYQLMDSFELSKVMVPGESVATAEDEDSIIPVAAALDALTDDDRRLIPHLRELMDGTPAIGDEPRADYAPDKPMVWKLEKKSKQLAELGLNASPSTLKRKMRQLSDGGPAALMRKTRREAPLQRVDPRVKTHLREVLNEHSKRSTLTKTAIYAFLDERLKQVYPSAKTRPDMPSVASVNRYIEEMDGGRGLTGSARTRATKKLSPKTQYTSRQVSAPGDETQIDSTRFDAFVRMPDGEVRRPWLTLLVDKRTRSIVGFNFSARTPISEDHALLVARALVPRQQLPWAKKYTELNLPEMPWAKYLSDEHRAAFDTHRPYIFPRTILSDNGKDFTSDAFHGVCGRYGIHALEAPIEDPTAKAQVERMFRTVREKFAQFLPGYTGGRTEFRGDKPDEEDVLSLTMVEELFDRWVAIVWQNRFHDSLDDEFEPDRKLTPNTMYAAAIETTGHFFVPVDPMDYLLLLPREPRNIRGKGIELKTNVYDSPHLAPLRDHTDADGRKTLFGVHYDPSDLTRVWLHNHIDDEWIECTNVDVRGEHRPLESALLAKAHQLHLANSGFTNRDADTLLLELKADVVAETKEREALELERILARADHDEDAKEAPAMSARSTPFDDAGNIADDTEEEGLEVL